MTIALVLTVKNEARLLRNNLLYHKAVGLCHAFVYFDDSTDGGKKSIADLEFVTLQDSVSAEKYSGNPYLKKFTSQAKEHHTARQCLNTYDALAQSKKLGYDWLISIDADELVATTVHAVSNLSDFFNKVPTNVTVVNFETREALQRKPRYDSVFAEETLFKTQPNYDSRFKNITKKIYNPFTKQKESFSYWYGQYLGKGAIRVKNELIPHNVHRYRHQDGTKPLQLNAGYLLHYHAYDADDFIKKFTNFSNRPTTYLSGTKVQRLKLLLRDVVNTSGMNQEALETYFKENVMFSKKEVQRLQKNRYLGFLKRTPPPLQEITTVQQVFRTKIDPS